MFKLTSIFDIVTSAIFIFNDLAFVYVFGQSFKFNHVLRIGTLVQIKATFSCYAKHNTFLIFQMKFNFAFPLFFLFLVISV